MKSKQISFDIKINFEPLYTVLLEYIPRDCDSLQESTIPVRKSVLYSVCPVVLKA